MDLELNLLIVIVVRFIIFALVIFQVHALFDLGGEARKRVRWRLWMAEVLFDCDTAEAAER